MKSITISFLIIVTHLVYLRICQEIVFYPSNNILVNNKRLKAPDMIKNLQRNFNVKEKNLISNQRNIRSVDPVFHGHPKTREEMWHEKFLTKSKDLDEITSLIKLIHNITLTYLNDCTPVILYDNIIKEQETYLFQNLLETFPVSFVHGYISDEYQIVQPKLLQPDKECLHFIVFTTDVKKVAKVLGKQANSKVVIIARSSQWAVQEFLSGKISRYFVNLLVISQSFNEENDYNVEAPFILYTHILYTDGLGASKPQVLCSWAHGKYSRKVNLFPVKMTEGYSGHRFVVAAANQPPFVFRRIQTDGDGGNPRVVWDGIEVRLLKLLAARNNFSVEIIEPRHLNLGSGDAVAREITLGRADIGLAGLYVTRERIQDMDMSFPHSQDCAKFITLMSTALPRYRAILGPFHWKVWVALTFTYLIGIFPLAFSDKHTLRHLIHNKGEVENMFWYVFGTFTNCFTFVGKNSWSKTTKITTRILIGWYWVFTIIITSCYTGSIIAFVTLPIYPETVDTLEQLHAGFYRIGTLDRGGWERWFFNSSDPLTNKLFKKLELVTDIEYGIKNITRAFFWPYAYLGSEAELEYIVQANFTKMGSKRSVLHISDKCFVPFGVSISFPNNSLYSAKLSNDLRRMLQGGILHKILDEVRWEMQRSSTGRHLSVGSASAKFTPMQEKGLTLEDTQGMFLLLGAGFLIAATSLISEWMGGFTQRCYKLKNRIVSRGVSTENIAKIEREITRSGERSNFPTRSSSLESADSLEGQVINVTEENLIIHYDPESAWNSKWSSSLDLSREVDEIFRKDKLRRKFSMEDIESKRNRPRIDSNDVFGASF